jgi:hypothetical protein
MNLARELSIPPQAWKLALFSKIEKAPEHSLSFDCDTRTIADALEKSLCQLRVREHAVSGRVELQVQFSQRDV